MENKDTKVTEQVVEVKEVQTEVKETEKANKKANKKVNKKVNNEKHAGHNDEGKPALFFIAYGVMLLCIILVLYSNISSL